MKNSNLFKVFSILVIIVIMICFATTVHAENNTGGFNDLTNTLTNPNTSANNSANNSSTGNNTNISNNSSNTNNTNNSSVYTNANLPKTGIGDSVPVVALVFVFGISAIYAYKKIKEYRNV